METPVVTGDITKGSGTETGTGMIWSRETNRYLTGQTWNSFVSYWMPFNWSGEGLHDASWRGSFGGQIYKGNGSNGCVNMPPPVVGQFFKETYIGLPVVVYNSDTQKIS